MVTCHDSTHVIRSIRTLTELLVVIIPFAVYIHDDITLDRLIRTSCQTVMVLTATCSLTT